LHPTQFYSSLFYCLLFIILKGVQKLNNDWLIIKIYFLSAALERFMIDFWRGDRQIIPDVMGGFFSTHQLIAMIIISFMVILIMSDCIQKKNFNSTRPR
jgi:prolipoprotein diacylglyceryltransferase